MKNTKKLVSIVLAMLMLISVFTVAPLTAGAAETNRHHTKANTEKKPTGDYTSGDYKYYLNDDGTAEITEYTGSDKDLVIPGILDEHKVVCIWDETFEDCDFIENIEIPDSVTYIDSNVFADTAYYKNDDNWENGVLYIGKFLIKADNISGTYSIKEGTTVIANDAFYEYHETDEYDDETEDYIVTYSELEEIIIPSTVTNIGYEAFSYCTKLKKVSMSNGVTTIGSFAFNNCESLTSITIPDSVTDIGNAAFSVCESLTSITIPDSVTYIGYDAFSYCDNLTNVTLSNNIKEINEDMFYCCTSLISITIPDSVTSIGMNAFDKCKSLTNVTLPDTITEIQSGAFRACTKLTNITIPRSVTYIGYETFFECEKLNNITISGNLTQIGSDAFKDTAYYNNASNWQNGVLYLGKYLLNTVPFALSASYSVKSNTELIADSAFFNCNGLTAVTIPDSVKYINDCAFLNCEKLANVSLGKNIKNIGDYTFENCALTSITIPTSVTSIGRYAFGYNEIEVEEDEYVDTKIDNFTINGYEKTAAETYANENGFTFNKLTPPPAPKGNAVTKKANTLKAKAVNKTIKAKKLKKKVVTFKAVKVSGAKGKVTYKVTKKNKKLKFKNGKVTVKKKTKKGTYKIKVKVTAAGTSAYKKGEKTVTIKVKVK